MENQRGGICDPEMGLQLPKVREMMRSWLLGGGTQCSVEMVYGLGDLVP